MDLVFATQNPNKIREVRHLLPPYIKLHTLQSLGCNEEIPETGVTLEENALMKARYIWDRYGHACFADDTGLLVTALDNAPGVYSARYAGEQKNAADNMRKLLREMRRETRREARFETVIALVEQNATHIFRGVIQGEITRSAAGKDGFGYDPVFKPKGDTRTFAEFPLQEKNRISHRARALNQLIDYLNQRKQANG